MSRQQRINRSTLFSALQLSGDEVVPNRVQVLRVGKFNHPQYGKFEITKQILAEMKKNFDERVRGIDIAFDYYHDSEGDASGWPKRLELSSDGTELFAEDVEWTPKGAQKIKDRELRYFSPDFTFLWTEPETGKKIKNVLFGGGLTNRPFVKEMQPIVADESNIESENEMTELEKAQKAAKDAEAKNVETQKQVETLTAQLAEVNKKLSEGKAGDDGDKKLNELSEQVKKLSEANTKLSEDAAKAAKETEFNKLLSDGKAVPAQKDAYLKNDMVEFVKLSQPSNMKAAGSSSSNGGAGDEGDDMDDKVIKLAEELEGKDKNLTRGEAMSRARKQLGVTTKR